MGIETLSSNVSSQKLWPSVKALWLSCTTVDLSGFTADAFVISGSHYDTITIIFLFFPLLSFLNVQAISLSVIWLIYHRNASSLVHNNQNVTKVHHASSCDVSVGAPTGKHSDVKCSEGRQLLQLMPRPSLSDKICPRISLLLPPSTNHLWSLCFVSLFAINHFLFTKISCSKFFPVS